MIFISYRKEDSRDLALSLADKLQDHFGKEAVFLDRDQIEPGDNWRDKIETALSKATVVLAVIGPRWLITYDEYGQRRIDQDDDILAYELSLALQKGKIIIPLYLHGIKPLPAKAFPGRLIKLADQQGIEFDIIRDLTSLLTKLQGITGLQPKKHYGGTIGGGNETTTPRKPWCIPDSIGHLFKGRTEAVQEAVGRPSPQPNPQAAAWHLPCHQ